MLSILIPTYNYSALKLVINLQEQCNAANILYEILVYDDCSSILNIENKKINELVNCSYTFLEKNIGRSSIRNLLAKNATYDTLLFLDVDTVPKNNTFITNYINTIDSETEIIYGGIEYQKNIPDKKYLLRWIYGRQREALSITERNKKKYLRFLTLSFIIKKSVFDKIKFNEEIPNLRHEDTLFALDAKKQKIAIKHVENPVIHLGLETSKEFLKKSIESVKVLKYFIDNDLLIAENTLLSKVAERVKILKLSWILKRGFKLFNPQIEKNLLSQKPSLLLFDLYRLGYYLQLK